MTGRHRLDIAKRVSTIILAVMFGFAVLAMASSAEPVQTQQMEAPYLLQFGAFVELFGNDTSMVTIYGTFVNPANHDTPVKAIMLPLGRASSVLVDFKRGVRAEGLQAELVNQSDVVFIKMVLVEPVPPGSVGSFETTYWTTSGGYVEKWVPPGSNTSTGEYRIFSFNLLKPNLTLVQGVTEVNVDVLLPRDALLTQLLPTMDLFYPNRPLVDADQWTRRTLVSWTNLTVFPGEGRGFVVTYSLTNSLAPLMSPTYPPENNHPSRPSGFAGSIALLLASNTASFSAAALLVYASAQRRARLKAAPEGRKTEETTSSEVQLLPEEIQILKAIEGAGGSVTQRDLPSLVGFSKSKVSRILKRLEELGLVSRTTLGRTKLIEISEHA
ncbi:MAG TPA: MarR family transcriptional regulator, partial [Candidatus Korarchaeota archaeon]|nr:MarR family transcriptional regulator [Candidatus Korarchaeota archaeon]